MGDRRPLPEHSNPQTQAQLGEGQVHRYNVIPGSARWKWTHHAGVRQLQPHAGGLAQVHDGAHAVDLWQEAHACNAKLTRAEDLQGMEKEWGRG